MRHCTNDNGWLRQIQFISAPQELDPSRSVSLRWTSHRFTHNADFNHLYQLIWSSHFIGSQRNLHESPHCFVISDCLAAESIPVLAIETVNFRLGSAIVFNFALRIPMILMTMGACVACEHHLEMRRTSKRSSFVMSALCVSHQKTDVHTRCPQ